jgi:hypothetical protein
MNLQHVMHIDPEEWQKILLLARIEAIAEQSKLFTWVDNQHTVPTLTGPKTVTVTFSNTWTTQEGMEELGE